MARGKGNSGPKSRTISPVNATKNGLKTDESAATTTPNEAKLPTSKKQQHQPSVKNGSPLSTSAVAKHKSAGKALSQQVEDKKKLRKRLRNGLLSTKTDDDDDDDDDDDGITVATTTTTKPVTAVGVEEPPSVVPVRVNVAKKSTTLASAKIVQKSSIQRNTNNNNRSAPTVNGKMESEEDDVTDVDAESSPSTAAALQPNVKIDVDFEDDSDESENEGLKQLMENIDQTLVCPASSNGDGETSTGDKPAAAVAAVAVASSEQLWMEMVAGEKAQTTATVAKVKIEIDDVDSSDRKRSCSTAGSPPVAASFVAKKKNKKKKRWNKGMFRAKNKKVDDDVHANTAAAAAPTARVTSTIEEIQDAIEAVVVKADVKSKSVDGDDDDDADVESVEALRSDDKGDATEDIGDSDVDKTLEVTMKTEEDEAMDGEPCEDEKTESFKSASSRLSHLSPAEMKPDVLVEVSDSENAGPTETINEDVDSAFESEPKPLLNSSVESVDKEKNKTIGKGQTTSEDSVEVLTSSFEEEDEDDAKVSVKKSEPEGGQTLKEKDDVSIDVEGAENTITATDKDAQKSPASPSSVCSSGEPVPIKDDNESATAKREDSASTSIEEIIEDADKTEKATPKGDSDDTKNDEKEAADIEEIKDEVTANRDDASNDEASTSLVKRKREDTEEEADEKEHSDKDKKQKLDDCSAEPAIDANKTTSVPPRCMLRRVFGVQKPAAPPPAAEEQTTTTTTPVETEASTATIVEDEGEEVTVGTTVTLSEDGQTCEGDSATPKKKMMYRMNKSELEMLVMSKLTEYFTDGNKSDISALRRRCEQLEKALEASRRKAHQYQKQLTDMQIVVNRAQVAKPFPGQPFKFNKPAMRSVGLQVQLTRYVPVSMGEACKTVSPQRQTYSGSSVARPMMSPLAAPPSAMGVSMTNPQNGPRMNNVKQIPSGLTLVSSMTTTGGLSRTYMNTTKVSPLNSSNTFATTTGNPIRSAPIIRLPVGDKTLNVRPLNTNVATNHLGISLLQPRMSITNTQGLNNLVFSAPIMTNAISAPHLVSRLTNLTDPSSITGLRPHIESGKIVSVTNTVMPVPMRLVPNQSVRQTTGNGIVITTTTAPTATSGTSPAKSVLVGQPKLASVKLIDLTADEEAAAAAAGASLLATSTVGNLTTVTTATGVGLLANKTLNTAGLTNTVSVLTSTLPSPGQILTINPAGTAITANMNTLRVGTPIIRTSTVSSGVSGGTSTIMGTAPMRYAYIVPSTSVMTMVRPNQPMFVSQNQGQRLDQPGTMLRPNVPTIVLQRGTTLVPLQGPMSSIRPGTINVRSLMTTNTMTTSSVTAASIAAATTVRNVVPTLVMPAPPVVVQQQSAASLGPLLAPKAMPPQPPSILSSTVASGALAAKSVLGRPATNTLLPPKSCHPALLPPQPLYCTKDLVSRRCLPPKPSLKISKVANGIVLSWNMQLNNTYAEIANYQLYAYQEGTSAPSSTLWKKVGDVRALPLPMACTLTQFVEGHKYYFAVRAVDVHGRIGPFSDAGSIALMAIVTNSGSSKPESPSKS